MTDGATFVLGDQSCRLRDFGFAAGVLHVYERFRFPDPGVAPHAIDVLLPRDYDQAAGVYPVVYMNDGHKAFFRVGDIGESWEMADELDRLYTAKAIRPVILVAIHPVDRNLEYTQAPGRPPASSGLERYTQAVAGTLKDFMDRHYRTDPGAERTMILGASHGGLAAFYMATRRPDRFGFAAALSPSFWCDLDDARDFPIIRPERDRRLSDSPLIAAVHATLADRQRRPTLFLQWGLKRDGGPHNEFIEEFATVRGREMAHLLQAQYGYQENRDLFVYEDDHGGHDEVSWRRRLPDALHLLAGIAPAAYPSGFPHPF